MIVCAVLVLQLTVRKQSHGPFFKSSDSRGGSHLKQAAGSIFSSDSLRPLSSYVSRSLSSLLHLLIPQRLGGAAAGARARAAAAAARRRAPRGRTPRALPELRELRSLPALPELRSRRPRSSARGATVAGLRERRGSGIQPDPGFFFFFSYNFFFKKMLPEFFLDVNFFISPNLFLEFFPTHQIFT